MVEAFKNAGLEKYFEDSYGYAIFPEVGKAGIGIGGAYGKGFVHAKTDGDDVKLVGNASLAQVSFGVQLGGQIYSEIIFFEKKEDFEKFSEGKFEFGAGAAVTALTYSADGKITTAGSQLAAGSSEDSATIKGLSYTMGMAVFTLNKTGLMYNFSVSGQKFSYTPIEE